MSEVLRVLQSVDGRYAVTWLPCFAKVLRLAARAIPKVKQRLVCIVGLVCGHGISAFFADYAASLASGTSELPRRVSFRTKNSMLPATEHGTECAWGNHRKKTVYWSQGLGEAWSGYWFTPQPCLFCDDVFAETADMVFMDAWLTEYVSDYRGTNLAIVRSDVASVMMQRGIDTGEISGVQSKPQDVIRSQRIVIADKGDGPSYRLWLAAKEHLEIPAKRVRPRRFHHISDILRWNVQIKASMVGHNIWIECRCATEFRRRMFKVLHIDNYLLSIVRCWFDLRSMLGKGIRSVVRRISSWLGKMIVL